MTNLFRVEFRRFRARRMVWVFAALALLGMVVAGTVLFFRTSDDVEGATARARRLAQIGYEQCLAEYPNKVPGEIPSGDGLAPIPIEACGDFDPSQIVADPRFHMRTYLDVATGTSAPIVVLALLLGASFAGAEWTHRTITTTLIYEPRRVRLLIAKALACAALIFVAALAVEALLGLVLLPAAIFHGTFAGIDGEWWRSLAGGLGRAAAMASLASIIGFSIASVGRNTVAALGAAFAYFAVIEGIIRGVKPQWQRWLLGDNAAQFVSGGGDALRSARSALAAGVLLSIYTVGAFVVAAGFFKRRDIA